MAKKKQRRDPYLTQAQLAGVVRYQPKAQVLLQALSDAQSQRDNDIAAAHTSAQGTVKALDLAKPQVQQLYTDAGLNPAAAQAPITPPAEVNFGTAATFEQQAGQHRLGASQARALQDLSDQRLSALAGGEYGAKAANARFAADSYKLSQQLASVGDQQGAFVAKTLGDLHDAARKRAVQIRGQNITLRGQNISRDLGQQRIEATLRGQDVSARGQDISSADRAAGRDVTLRGQDISRENSIRSSRGKAGGRSAFTPVARRTVARTVRSGLSTLEGLPTKISPAAAEHIALHGLPDPDNPKGRLAIKPITNDPFLAKVIAERYHLGGVRKKTNRRLRKQYGITVKHVNPYTQALGDVGLPGLG